MFARIMVPLDRTPEAEAALAPAATIARAHGAELHLVLVLPKRMTELVPSTDHGRAYHEYHDGPMQQLATELRLPPGLKVVTAISKGETADVLTEYAAEQKIDLIVMSTHGRTGWSRAWAGSVADELIHATQTPVLMVRRTPAAGGLRVQRVLVAIEGGEQGREAAVTALDAFDGPGVVIILAQVIAPVPVDIDPQVHPAIVLVDTDATQKMTAEAELQLAELAAGLRTGRQATIECVVQLAAPVFPVTPVAGTVADLAVQRRVDVVVLTSHERGWTRLLAGSVADRILNDTECMLLIRHSVTPAEASLSYAITATAAEVTV